MQCMRTHTCLALVSLVSFLPLAGCDKVQTDVFIEGRSSDDRAAQPRAKGPIDRHLALRGRKPQPGSGFVQAPPDTWAPFDVSVRTGLFDARRTATADGTRACLELSRVDFSVFYDVCADYDAAGGGTWSVVAFHGPPATFLAGSALIAGPELELRTETDGATLRFHARAAGAKEWSPVSEMPFPVQTLPLKAAVGATNLRKGTTIGFDDPSYASAPAPGPLSPEAGIAEDANAALLAGLDAFLALDGPSPDLGAAATALGEAALALGEAQTGADALASPAATTVRRRLAASAKALDAAERQVDGGRADRAIAKLVKAGRSLVQAVLILSPQPNVGAKSRGAR
jgi:hypothetical protein